MISFLILAGLFIKNQKGFKPHKAIKRIKITGLRFRKAEQLRKFEKIE
jgi:hypothetical protein